MGFPEAYDGPLLFAWLKERGALDGSGKSSFARIAYRWRSGDNPSYLAVDRWLTPRGIHLDEIPDEIAAERVGREPKRRRSPGEIEELRKAARRLMAEGARNFEIARQLGVTPRTVSNWRKKMEAEQ